MAGIISGLHRAIEENLSTSALVSKALKEYLKSKKWLAAWEDDMNLDEEYNVQ